MRNQILWAALLCAYVSGAAFAQQVQRSSNPRGIQIQGDTQIKADQESTYSTAKGEGNAAKNTAGTIKAETGEIQIQGNTRITASQRNTRANAEGKNSKAGNEAGAIGGN